MPVKLSTTISKIESLSNSVNSKLISELCEYMKKNGLSESHINNSLKTNMLFSEFLDRDISFYDIKSKEQIINFLDSKMKSPELDHFGQEYSRWIFN
mgnify:FL=1